MRTRVLSAVLVAVVGLVPILIGGALFFLLMAAIGVAGYREYLALGRIQTAGTLPSLPGYVAVALLSLAGWLGWGAAGVGSIAAGGTILSLVLMFGRTHGDGGFTAWALAVAGMLYLGIPVLAATSLRSLPGTISSGWLNDLSARAASAGSSSSRGLAWVLVVVLAIWVGDSAAFLWGRSFGRRPLAPTLSPNKTVEGAIAGLAGSALVGVVGSHLFGLDLPLLLTLGIGTAVGLAGQAGDLAESFFKRQSGVKDSGSVIPGHGGVLDRIDALLFALPLGWFIATLVERTIR